MSKKIWKCDRCGGVRTSLNYGVISICNQLILPKKGNAAPSLCGGSLVSGETTGTDDGPSWGDIVNMANEPLDSELREHCAALTAQVQALTQERDRLRAVLITVRDSAKSAYLSRNVSKDELAEAVHMTVNMSIYPAGETK